MAIKVARTFVGSIQNHRQVCGGFDLLGKSTSTSPELLAVLGSSQNSRSSDDTAIGTLV
ncbi:hypothetical protein [Halocatena halophila]|uniref:hypothetical protein n=1 Tax=Halocatena halophila TaxID=2814576 RepID=UPI002ED53702